MDKKIFKFLLMFFVLLVLFSCSEKSVKKKENEQGKTKVLKQGQEIKKPQKTLIGDWKAKKLAESWEAFRYSLPCTLELRKNKTYSFSVKIGVIVFESQGTFTVSIKSKPFKITLYQTYPKKAVHEGVFGFRDKDTLKIIFYDRIRVPRPTHFKKNNINVFKRE